MNSGTRRGEGIILYKPRPISKHCSFFNEPNANICSILILITDGLQNYWSMHGEMQIRLIVLTEEIASALSSEFKLYIPEILPHLLHIFMYDSSADKAVTLQVCSGKFSSWMLCCGLSLLMRTIMIRKKNIH